MWHATRNLRKALRRPVLPVLYRKDVRTSFTAHQYMPWRAVALLTYRRSVPAKYGWGVWCSNVLQCSEGMTKHLVKRVLVDGDASVMGGYRRLPVKAT